MTQPNFAQLKPVASQPNFAQLKPVTSPVAPAPFQGNMGGLGNMLGITETQKRGAEAGQAYREGKISGSDLATESVLGVGSLLAKATGVPALFNAADYIASGKGSLNPIPEKNLYTDIKAGIGSRVNQVANIPAVKNYIESPKGQSITRGLSSAMDISTLLPLGPAKNALGKVERPKFITPSSPEAEFNKNLKKVLPPKPNEVTRQPQIQADAKTAFTDIYNNHANSGIVDEVGATKKPTEYNVTETAQAQKPAMQASYARYTNSLSTVDKAKFQTAIDKTVSDQVGKIDHAITHTENSLPARNALNGIKTELSTLVDKSPIGIQNYVESIGERTRTAPGHPPSPEQIKLANLGGELRAALDSHVENIGGNGYQAERNVYKAHKTIQKSLQQAAVRQMKQTPGLIDNLTNLGLTGEGINFLVTHDPHALAVAAGIKGMNWYTKMLRSPDRAIQNIFKQIEREQGQSKLRMSPETPSYINQSASNVPKNSIGSNISRNPRGIYPVRLSDAPVRPPRQPLGANRLLEAPKPPAIPLGGEVLGQKVDARGNLIRPAVGKSGVSLVPAKQGAPRVNPLSGRMEKTYTAEAGRPHVKVELPPNHTPQHIELRNKINANVDAQKRAIRAGDAKKVSALKSIYNTLIKKWDALVQRVKDTPNKTGGFARNPFFKKENPLGKNKQFQFVSPNKGKLNIDEAISAVKSPQQKEFRNKFEALNRADGITGKLHDGVGEWGDGGENTFVQHVNDSSSEKSVYNLAKKAKVAGQTDAINFELDKTGKDELYTVTPETKDIKQMKAILDKNGIIFKTLGDTIYVVNKAGDYFDPEMGVKMDRVGEALGKDITYDMGNATFLTGLFEATDRPKAMKVYQGIIDNYEKKYGKNSISRQVQGSEADSNTGKSPHKKSAQKASIGDKTIGIELNK